MVSMGGALTATEAANFYTRLNTYMSAVFYVGPGDLVPGATGWWGLRAYANGTIGTNAVRLREDGGNTEQDFATIAGGGLDLAAISSFKGANNLFVAKLYDQSGNGRDAVQATAVDQPRVDLATLGTLPAIFFDTSNNRGLFVNAAFTAPTPFSLSSVLNPAPVSSHSIFAGVAGDVEVRITSSLVYQMLKEDVALLASSGATTAAWQAFLASYDAATVAFYINGSSSGGGADATGVAATGPFELANAGNNERWSGYANEWGVWGSILNSTQAASLSANQRSYWGF
jgi:hypothetical protein